MYYETTRCRIDVHLTNIHDVHWQGIETNRSEDSYAVNEVMLYYSHDLSLQKVDLTSSDMPEEFVIDRAQLEKDGDDFITIDLSKLRFKSTPSTPYP